MQNSSIFTPNFKCHSTAKLCALTFYTFFPLGGFEVLKQKFEERGKVLSAHIDKVMTSGSRVRVFDQVLVQSA
jgi:hypothetical protein